MVVEEDEEGHQQDLPNNIVKGKRTKRQRPQSPIPFTITTQYSSSGEGGYVSNNNEGGGPGNGNSSSSSAEQVPSIDHHYDNAATTEEDEYTARCLILLAQGDRQQHKTTTSHRLDHDQDYGAPEKFNSKRYIEAPISGNGKAGMYVYECKTCGRTFPSFQALGGHRASHKKPKNIAADEKKMFTEIVSDDEEEIAIKNVIKNNNNNNSSSLSPEFISNRGILISNLNLPKSASFPRIHECSHCGAEFTSGQALGGHMRRHRGAAPAIANTTLFLGQSSLETMDQDSDQEPEAKRFKNSNGLSLDLNLPAPEDDHHHQQNNNNNNKESKFGLASKQQQQQKQQKQEEKQPTLVLSTTTKLVDCRY